MKVQTKQLFCCLLTVLLVLLLPVGALAQTALTGTQAADADGTVTISGTVTDAVAGQKVAILIVEDGTSLGSLTASDIVYMAQTAPDGNGDYEVSFTMPQAKRTGAYDVYVGTTNVPLPAQTDLTYATPAPVAPVVSMGDAKAVTNGANAFYYFITITLNDGMATAFTVKHYPSDQTDSVAKTQTANIDNIQGVAVKVISLLKGIPDAEADRSITSTATLTYTLGGNSGTASDTRQATLNTAGQ